MFMGEHVLGDGCICIERNNVGKGLLQHYVNWGEYSLFLNAMPTNQLYIYVFYLITYMYSCFIEVASFNSYLKHALTLNSSVGTCIKAIAKLSLYSS